jgi:hypothetical protein
MPCNTPLKLYQVTWRPTGEPILTTYARSAKQAIVAVPTSDWRHAHRSQIDARPVPIDEPAD